ncbi:hypothetical protein ABK040_000341 [Willaertia magna]
MSDVFRDYEVFCGQIVDPSEYQEVPLNAMFELTAMERFYGSEITPILSIHPTNIDYERYGPYFHYGANYQMLKDGRD